MNRSTLVIFGIFTVLCAIVIPAWAISREGGESASPEDVPPNLEEGKDLFVTNCGVCHTLAKAGTDGVVGPNLDDLLAPGAAPPNAEGNTSRALNAIQNGFDSSEEGRMPAGILSGEDAEVAARFVGEVAGQP
jgi:mono/diheme cytochrome c family protein